jgi:cation diffusion facilitator CzcD-associated flavoprotein CzcO
MLTHLDTRTLTLYFRLADKQPPPLLSDLAALASRSADAPIPLPDRLPAQRPKIANPRYAESSIYPYLETNIDSIPMEFTQEPIPAERSQRSIALHGHDTPFRHWSVMQRYIQGLVDRDGYQDLVSYNTTVERAEKVGHEWKVTLRKDSAEKDYWWVEWFDAVVVASGHYSVPYVPAIEGLEQFEKLRPGSVMHSKQFRGKEYFQGKVSFSHLSRDLYRG